MRLELTERLLPFWAEQARDDRHGGYVGRITQEGTVVVGADKGVVLTARILWTFSAALRKLGDAARRAPADRARAYLDAFFWDPAHEGVYWTVGPEGQPRDTRKHIYAQAFALYGLAEYHRATGDPDALARAVRLFERVERHARDRAHGGYFEAFDRDWGPLHDVRLSTKDLHAAKSMNTNLHVLEAYTTLYRTHPDARLRDALAALVDVFLERILAPTGDRLLLFFDPDWTPLSGTRSFGHDIEASWLLRDAADAVGDDLLRRRVRPVARALARATRRDGQDADGGLFNEAYADGRLDDDKHWWPQAEAVVGFLAAYQDTGDDAFRDAALAAWAFTERHLLDHHGGEWYGRVARDGTPYPDEDKVGLWKCPYHNARACLEALARTAPHP